MLDLFAKPKNDNEPAPARPLEDAPGKNPSNEPRGTPPPKNFQVSVGNIDQVVAPPKIHPDPCDKLHEDASKKKRDRIKRVSAMVKPPTEEELRAEGCIVEDADDPRRTDKWSPRWSPRVGHPTKRGWEANINAIHLLESKTQLPKPDVIDWREKSGLTRDFPWNKAEPDILKFVSAGGTVSAYCQASGLSYLKVRGHIHRTPTFKAQIAEARVAGADALAAEALNIASSPMLTEERITVYDKNDNVVTKSIKLADNTYARKLAFQARMQLLEKWAPEKYGPNAKPEETGGMAEKLRAARERIRSAMRVSREAERKSSSERS